MPVKQLDEEALFHAARRIAAGEARALFIEQACGGDAGLAERVRALLEMHEQEADSAEPPPMRTFDYEPITERPGSRVGPYRLMEQIGEGGFGLVFVAEQQEPVKRKVALKVIKPGMDSRQVIARFEAERQALALMDHPNIARVLDAGATESGRPYFVMELVRGIPITEYCDKNQLTPRERLELFVTVCQAVQHAHQKGIIHRDIKPSNVLVTSHDGKPVAKIIDFGVAKAINQHLTERTIYTQFAQMIGTPLYMSPEQAEMSGLDIDTRSDIYSLGVLLYELLTGTTPLEKKRFAQAAYDEIRKMIREEEPPRPSTRLSQLGRSGEPSRTGSAARLAAPTSTLASIAAQRHTEPAKLSKLVRGDLDWITMKCLEKDRTRRYETANGLARDIERHLHDEPVEACPPSATYRLRKLAKKHKAGLATAAAIAALLLAGITVSTWQAVRATIAERAALAERDAKEQARQAEVTQRKEAETQRDRADKAAATAKAIQTFLLTDTLGALAPEHTRGKQITVDQVLVKAAAEAGQAFREQPETEAAVRATIGHTYLGLGLYTAAESQLTSALEIQRRVLGEEHPDTLGARHILGDLRRRQARWSEAEALLRQALETRQRVLGEEHPDTLATVETLATLLREHGGLAEAESLYRQNLPRSRRILGPEHPTTLYYMNNLASLLQRKGQLAEAEPLAREVLEARSRVLGPDHPQTLWSIDTLGVILHDQKKLADAEPLFRQTLETSRRVLGDEHPETLFFMSRLATLLLDLGQLAEAESLSRGALDTAQRVFGPEHAWTASYRGAMVRLLTAKGDRVQAEALLREALAICREKLPKDDPQLASALFQLGASLLAQNKAAEAEPLLRECLAIRERKLPKDDPQLALALFQLGASLLAQNKAAEAEPLLRECLAIREKKLPDDWLRFDAESVLGGSLLRQKKYADAEPFLVQGYLGLKQREKTLPAWGQKRPTQALERLVELYDGWAKPDEAAKWRKELQMLKGAEMKP